MAGEVFEQAQQCYNAGNFQQCRDLAVQGLAERPDDLRLLRLAGSSSLELSLDDASTYLRKVVELAPDDGSAWRDLGLAYLDDGEMDGAAEAFRHALRLQPDDVPALVNLGYLQYRQGQTDEGLQFLSRAAELDPRNTGALRGLVDMERHAGRLQSALDTAKRIAQSQPDDVLALLDVADLSLEVGDLNEAVASYGRLRGLDVEPGHEIFAYHGMIEAEMRRERWRRALDLTIDATRVDRYDLTTQLLAFLVAQVFGRGDRPAPDRTEVDAALAAERADHRRFHTASLVSA